MKDEKTGAEAKVLAACGQCGRRVRIPNSSRARPCKHCGGAVLPLRTEDPEPDDEPRLASSRRSFGDDVLLLQSIRWLFVIGFVFFVFAASVTLWGASSIGEDGSWWIAYAAISAMATTALAGAILFPFQPVLWTVLLAVGSTGCAVLAFASGVGGVDHLGWGQGLWLTVPIAFRLQSLQRERPESYFAHSLVGTSRERAKLRSSGPVSPEDEARLLASARRRARVRAAVACSLLSILALTAAFLGANEGRGSRWRAPSPPEELPSFLDRAEAAWNDSEIESFGDLFAFSARSENRNELNAGIDRRGWRGSMPVLLERKIEEREHAGVVEWKTVRGPVRAKASWTALEWVLDELVLPPVPIGDFPDRFRAAWNEGSMEDVLAFFTPERGQSIRAQLEGMQETWSRSDERPKFLELETVPQPWDQCEVRCTFEGGVLVLACRLEPILRWEARGVSVLER